MENIDGKDILKLCPVNVSFQLNYFSYWVASLFANTVWYIGNFLLEILFIEWNCEGNEMYVLITVDGDISYFLNLNSLNCN